MFKKIYPCDCFLDLAAYCPETNADFDCFRSLCVWIKWSVEIYLLFVMWNEGVLFFRLLSLLFVARILKTFRQTCMLRQIHSRLSLLSATTTGQELKQMTMLIFITVIFLWKITTMLTMIVTLITVVVTMTLTVDKLTVLLAVFVFVEWEPVWSLLGFVWSVEILFLRYFTQKMHLLEKNTFLVW